jgi:hypothetical protein
MMTETAFVDDLMRRARDSLARAEIDQKAIDQAFWHGRIDALVQWQAFNRERAGR